MNIYSHVQSLESKLDEVLADNLFTYTFNTKKFPIVLTVAPDTSPEAQTELFSNEDGDVSSRDAKLKLIFQLNELKIQTDSRLIIPDALMSKIKGLAKKLHYAYLQAFFADRIGVVQKTEAVDEIEKDACLDDPEEDSLSEDMVEDILEETEAKSFDEFFEEPQE